MNLIILMTIRGSLKYYKWSLKHVQVLYIDDICITEWNVLYYCSITILDMMTANANGESSGVYRNLEEKAHYLETEYNNTLSGNYKLVQDYGSTSDVDKE